MAANEDVVIQIDNLKKGYRLGSIGGRTLREDIQSWWARKHGKQDPNMPIALRGIKGDYFYALNGLNLTVNKSDALGIVGSNGAGKSTMLKILSRITAPSEGEVKIKGRIASMLEVGTGFHGELTGRENIYLNGAILGMKKEEIDQKLEDIIEFSECRQFIDTPVKRYSSGMYVKLAFSVAAHLDSEILIMDEVLAVGDMKFQRKCIDKMNEISKKEGRTILYVSHNMATIEQLCNRCIVLNKGEIIFDGDTKEAISLYLDNVPSDSLSVDYTKILRPSWLSRDDVRIKMASYGDRDSSVFVQGELVKLNMEWENVRQVEKLCMRVELTGYFDSPCATACIYDFYEGEKGACARKTFILNTQNLAPGKYKTMYTFFFRGNHNQSVDVDCVKGLDFEIKEARDMSIKWVSKSWGDCILPDIEAVDCE